MPTSSQRSTFLTIWESCSKHLSQSLESHIDSLKLCVGIVDFELYFPKTLSNAKMVYISNVDLDDWSNLVIHDVSSWDHLGFQNQASRCKNSKFKLWEFETFVKWKVDHYTNCRTRVVSSSATPPTVKPITPAPSVSTTMARSLHDYSTLAVANVPVGPTANTGNGNFQLCNGLLTMV